NDRRKKKGYARRLWQIQIGAATKQNDLSYSKFINGLKKSHIELDRKILSDLAQHEPEIFKRIVEISQSAIK
ncbi:MAG: 50S ribosomal protein L20, partial [Candidatus Azambacteria bacterium]|nr:50S ribosomal protein L20 [Candidatus Azambacteria bacterium]